MAFVGLLGDFPKAFRSVPIPNADRYKFLGRWEEITPLRTRSWGRRRRISLLQLR